MSSIFSEHKLTLPTDTVVGLALPARPQIRIFRRNPEVSSLSTNGDFGTRRRLYSWTVRTREQHRQQDVAIVDKSPTDPDGEVSNREEDLQVEKNQSIRSDAVGLL